MYTVCFVTHIDMILYYTENEEKYLLGIQYM